MRVISIKYRPIRFLPLFRSVTKLVPSRWQDVSRDQLDCFEQLAKNRIYADNFIVAFFGLKKSIVNMMSDWEKYNVLEVLEFMGDTENYIKYVSRHGRPIRLLPDQIHSPLSIMIKQKENKNEQKNE